VLFKDYFLGLSIKTYEGLSYADLLVSPLFRQAEVSFRRGCIFLFCSYYEFVGEGDGLRF